MLICPLFSRCFPPYAGVQSRSVASLFMQRKLPISGRPTWAKAIRALRMTLELNQAEFGSRVGFSAMAVSRWERGAQEPPAHAYIALGNLSPETSCWFFWERAGLRTENVLRVVPTLERITSTSALQGFEILNARPAPK